MKQKRPHHPQVKSGLLAEISPASAYYGTDSCETAREKRRCQPGGKRLGFDGAEPNQNGWFQLPVISLDTNRAIFIARPIAFGNRVPPGRSSKPRPTGP